METHRKPDLNHSLRRLFPMKRREITRLTISWPCPSTCSLDGDATREWSHLQFLFIPFASVPINSLYYLTHVGRSVYWNWTGVSLYPLDWPVSHSHQFNAITYSIEHAADAFFLIISKAHLFYFPTLEIVAINCRLLIYSGSQRDRNSTSETVLRNFPESTRPRSRSTVDHDDDGGIQLNSIF